MSTSVETPQSPKKRKIESGTLVKSKKRRKHTESEIEEPPKASQSSQVKEKKSKRRSKKLDQKETDQNGDVDMADDTEPVSPDSRKEEEVNPVENGVDHALELNTDIMTDAVEETDDTLLSSQEPTCFYSKRLSLYLPIPAVSLATTIPSLLSLHLSPLLLTYYPPVGGVVLSFSDPVLTAKAETGVNLPLQPPRSGEIPRNPPDETFAQCADQFGVCWVWLTATFLVFAPQPGDQFTGWANIQSESFIGLVSYNYFQTSILRNRIPKRWSFDGPSREQRQKRKTKKGRLHGTENEDMEVDTSQTYETPAAPAVDLLDGSFLDEHGNKVPQKQTIRVHDIDMTPGSERSRFGLQIDGSLLSPTEEEAVLAEEKRQYDVNRKRRSRSQTPALENGELPLMSGAVPLSREVSVA